MNGNRCGDHTLPDHYCTGSKNGYGTQQVNPFRMAGVPKREYPSGSTNIRSAIPEGFGKEGDT
jgi:hypothetical protein